jgi:hypothetical protein
MIKVRRFVEADRPTLRAIFREAGEEAPSASLWGHEASEAAIYLDPYIDHAPDSLFVAACAGLLVVFAPITMYLYRNKE